MEFTLTFSGDLKPRGKGGIKHIHAVRKEFEPQLKRLWDCPPLSEHTYWQQPKSDPYYSLREERNGSVFIPVVSANVHIHAELQILFLRAGNDKSIISNDGDLDNRLKTLLDALRIPTLSEAKQLGKISDEPFFCLLQDDDLITRLDVRTDRWLAEKPGSKRTMAVINVKTKATRVTTGNLSLA